MAGTEVLYAGVDGGGSTCRVRVRDADGALRAVGTGGAANVYLDFDTAIGTIAATLSEAMAQAGGAPSAIGLGLAGVSSQQVAERVAAALAAFAPMQVTHDGDIACLGAHAGGDGGLIIAGTGSGAVARIGRASTTIGGRGFILGDEGSGARLGLDALREALKAHDGLADHTPLTRDLLARFGNDPVAAIAWGRTARPSDFAALAPLVVAAADVGDPAGIALVRAAAAAVEALAAALQRLGAPRLSFVGGLAPALTPYLPDPLRLLLRPVLFDALDGALLLAGCPLSPPTP